MIHYVIYIGGMHFSLYALYLNILKVTKTSCWKPTYFNVEKKNLISQTMLENHIPPSDYIHKFLYFFQHRTKIRRHIVDHQPFCVNSKVCRLAVCHRLLLHSNHFPCWAHTWCLINNRTSTLFLMYIMFYKNPGGRLIISFTMDFEWLTEQ